VLSTRRILAGWHRLMATSCRHETPDSKSGNTMEPAEGTGGFEGAAIAVCAHGLAGDAAAEHWTRRGLIASDLLNFLPEAWRRLDQSEVLAKSF
ncbi:MAG: hypothetical protein ACOVRM_09800, partial [Planctomycetaceae bacterium]